MMMMIKIYLAVLIFGVLNTAARTIMLPTTPTGNGRHDGNDDENEIYDKNTLMRIQLKDLQ